MASGTTERRRFQRLQHAVVSGALKGLHGLEAQISWFRPPRYDELDVEAQRITDGTLWAAFMLLLVLLTLCLVFLIFGSYLGLLVAAFGATLTVVTLALVQRKHAKAGVALLTANVVFALDGYLLVSGGQSSTTALWYVIAPCVLIVLVPAPVRVIGLVGLLGHQLALSALLSTGVARNILGLPPAVLLAVDYLLSVSFAGAFGLAIALTRRQMVERLARAKRDVGLAMTHILTGFFVLDRNGMMVVDTSEALQKWLGGGREGDTLYTCLRQRDEELAERFRVGFETLLDDELPAALCLDQLPSTVSVSGRHFDISYRLWHDDEVSDWSRLVVTLRDVTHQRRREEAMLHRQALAVFVRGLQRNRTLVERYVENASALVHQVRTCPESPEWKGWLDELAALARESELTAITPHYAEAKRMGLGGARPEAGIMVARVWEQVLSVFESLHDEHDDNALRADQEQYERLQDLVMNRAPRAALLAEVEAWAGESTARAIVGAKGSAGGHLRSA